MFNLTSTLLSYVLLYKYLALFVITFLGAFALPLPSGTTLIASAAFSLQGYFSLPWIIIVGILGNMAGDSAGYWLARRFGAEVLRKIGLRKLVDSHRYALINEEICNHPILIIYFSRFMTGVAPTVNVVCGITKLSYRKFLTFEALGEFTEVSLWIFLGYVFGANWESLVRLSGPSWLLIFGGAILTYLFWHYIINSRRRPKFVRRIMEIFGEKK